MEGVQGAAAIIRNLIYKEMLRKLSLFCLARAENGASAHEDLEGQEAVLREVALGVQGEEELTNEKPQVLSQEYVVFSRCGVVLWKDHCQKARSLGDSPTVQGWR